LSNGCEAQIDGNQSGMNNAEIISIILKLSHEDRRKVVRTIMDLEDTAETLAECDRAALERFQMLDEMETER
jgi:hypothetical protein